MFSKQGDVFILDDKHVLMCGDSTNEDIIKAIMYLFKDIDAGNIQDYIPNNIEQFMIYTDPPYNAGFIGRTTDHETLMNDFKHDPNDYVEFIRSWYTAVFNLFTPEVVTYIWCNNYLKGVIEQIDTVRWLTPKALLIGTWRNITKRPIIWVKNNFGMGKNYRPKYEMVLFDGKIDKDILNECDVWVIPKDNGDSYIHPTQKPIECFARGMRNHTAVKYVIDSFAGSGSSLIAAIDTNKTWLGMEFDAQYIDKILRRFYDYTFSKDIKLIRDGVEYDFEFIAKELHFLSGANKKGVVDDTKTRLF